MAASTSLSSALVASSSSRMGHPEHHACNGHALALAARELDPALAHLGFIAVAALEVGQRGDEVGGFGLVGGRAHFLFAGVGAAVEDVVAHGAVQQRGVLRHHADGAAQAVLGHAANVLAVDGDAPALHLVKAQQQIDQRGLARARAADQANARRGGCRGSGGP